MYFVRYLIAWYFVFVCCFVIYFFLFFCFCCMCVHKYVGILKLSFNGFDFTAKYGLTVIFVIQFILCVSAEICHKKKHKMAH